MKIKRVLFYVLLINWLLPVYAQIKPISSHFNFLNELYNPAFYGIDEQYKFALNYRNQWARLDGAPSTINFLSSFYLPKLKSGIGMNITNDQIGAFKNNQFQLGYNYIIPIKDKLKIGIGAQAGFEFSKLDGTKLITPNGDYSSGINHNDDYLNNQKIKSFRPFLNIGISMNTKYLDLGIAYLNSINNANSFDGILKELKPTYKSVLQTNLKSKIKTGENFSIEPALMINTDFVNIQTDFQLMFNYRSFVGLGTNIRGYNKNAFESVSSIIKISPLKNKMLGIIYSYDFTFKELGNVNKGSHEITLYYNMRSIGMKTKLPKFINNPRFL